MNKGCHHKQGFTMVEVLMACSVGVIVLGVMMILLVQSLRIWRDGSAMMQLTFQSRMARERVLRGLDGRNGLRQASSRSFAITPGGGSLDRLLFRVDPGDWPTADPGDDYAYTLDTDAERRLRVDGPFLTVPLYKPGFRTEVVALSSSGRTVHARIEVTLQTGGRSYTNRQIIQTFLCNP